MSRLTSGCPLFLEHLLLRCGTSWAEFLDVYNDFSPNFHSYSVFFYILGDFLHVSHPPVEFSLSLLNPKSSFYLLKKKVVFFIGACSIFPDAVSVFSYFSEDNCGVLRYPHSSMASVSSEPLLPVVYECV